MRPHDMLVFLAVIGLSLMSYGVFQIYRPAGFIFTGLWVFLLAGITLASSTKKEKT